MLSLLSFLIRVGWLRSILVVSIRAECDDDRRMSGAFEAEWSRAWFDGPDSAGTVNAPGTFGSIDTPLPDSSRAQWWRAAWCARATRSGGGGVDLSVSSVGFAAREMNAQWLSNVLRSVRVVRVRGVCGEALLAPESCILVEFQHRHTHTRSLACRRDTQSNANAQKRKIGGGDRNQDSKGSAHSLNALPPAPRRTSPRCGFRGRGCRATREGVHGTHHFGSLLLCHHDGARLTRALPCLVARLCRAGGRTVR